MRVATTAASQLQSYRWVNTERQALFLQAVPVKRPVALWMRLSITDRFIRKSHLGVSPGQHLPDPPEIPLNGLDASTDLRPLVDEATPR